MKKSIAGLFFAVSVLLSAENVVNMEEITVTASKEATDIRSTPKNVEVITREEAERKIPANLSDVLKLSPIVSVSDMMANGRGSTVDIRGQGESCKNNIALVVDGVIEAPIDMSGNDYNIIDTENIESIELIAGPSGVLYGDRALGGVINITTKKNRDNGFGGYLKYDAGSYGYSKITANVSGGLKNINLGITVSKNNLEGYRKNSQTDGTFLYIDSGIRLDDRSQINIKYRKNSDEYHMPGALTKEEMDKDRKEAIGYNSSWTRVPDRSSFLEINEDEYTVKYEYRGKKIDIINISGIEEKNTKSEFISDYKSDIDTKFFRNDFKLKYKNKLSEFTAGIDYFNGKSSAQSRTIEKETLGKYFLELINILNCATVSFGMRNEDASLIYTGGEVKEYNKTLIESGLNVKYSKFGNIFFNYSEGYRIPTTDEYFEAGNALWGTVDYYNKNLKPQEIKGFEIGIREGNDFMTGKAAAYFNGTENEIYYNPLNRHNENMPGDTSRTGVEVSLEEYAGEMIKLKQYYTYTYGKFEDGIYKGKEVPAVSRHRAGIGIDLILPNNVNVTASANYNGESYAVSDFDNNLKKTDGYFIVNTAVTGKISEVTLGIEIDNILNEKYCSYVVDYGALNYYPAPERTIKGTIKYNF